MQPLASRIGRLSTSTVGKGKRIRHQRDLDCLPWRRPSTDNSALYFLPLPQGQGTLRPIPWRRPGTSGSSDPVSW